MEGTGQPEVQHLDLAFRRNLHVGRLQVTVNDSFFMRSFQPFRNLAAHLQSFLKRQCIPVDALRKRFTLDQFQNKKAKG